MIPFILKTNSVALFPPGESPLLIDREHANFTAVVEALKAGDFAGAVDLASVPAFIKTVSGGAVSISDEGISFKGELLTGYLADKMMQFFRDGLPVQHYCTFLSNVMANPSMVARKELYLFLEAADLPITEDGHFLAYKAVRSDFMDIYSGKFDNSPGTSHSMPRSAVDDDRNVTCSEGFHAAAYTYAKNFMHTGGKLVAVKINPADVVSVPSDYANQKLRCCRYEVAFEVPDAADIFKGRATASSSTPFDDDDDDNASDDDDVYDNDFWNSKAD